MEIVAFLTLSLQVFGDGIRSYTFYPKIGSGVVERPYAYGGAFSGVTRTVRTPSRGRNVFYAGTRAIRVCGAKVLRVWVVIRV